VVHGSRTVATLLDDLCGDGVCRRRRDDWDRAFSPAGQTLIIDGGVTLIE
jgi:hypothetical protein